jgi:phosphatidylglycerol lysyltransferase
MASVASGGASLSGLARVRAILNAASPGLASLGLFIGGAGMLVSAVTPQLSGRLRMVAEFAPLGVIELSHFAGSIIATLMLFLGYGVARRLSAARRAAIALCLIAAPLSLLKGFVWEEALVLVLIAALLAATRPAYYRQSRLSAIRTAGWWNLAVLGAVGVAAWAGFASYEHIPYNQDLWWTFLLDGDVSRFLRALTGVAIVTGLILLWRYAGPAPPPRACAADEGRALAILGGGGRNDPQAWLALTGDKSFLFSESGRSMIMYAPHGDAWIAMGGPAGPASERRELIWRFREAADMANVWPAFYSVGPDLLPDLLDAGLVLQKVGETALVPLDAFALEGSTRAKLRQARARGQRDGFVFAVEAVEPGSALAHELRDVSDAWLAHHKGTEKGFSLGKFDEASLARLPVGVLRRNGVAEAFASLWPGGPGGDIAVDLMRAKPGIPRGAMEVLFIELMLWAKAEGYRQFDLGMAPLAGLENRRLAPWLSRIGAMVYRHGNTFYGFEGLREFKNKFDPVWEPRYLAAPGAWRLSAALGRVALLTAGGIRGMLKG